MRVSAAILASGMTFVPLAQGALVSFAQTEYTVGVGQSLPLDVMIGFEQGDSATDLFSFGIRVVPDPGTPFVLEGIDVVADLNFFRFSGGSALIDPDPGILGAKGSVVDLQSPYAGAVLATYRMHFTTPGSYPASLTFFNTLGPTEQIFVGGNGNVLDPEIRFGTTIIIVIPEPGAVTLLALMSLGIAMRRTRRFD